ncbi:ribonuclease Oy-like [Leptopilina boulardi]|uniref:ribonuclease Oy-like n=1 Tax=Leptopilina boulardi TaxID=63433 RepID=UPI0021F61ED5|nr:ribonuclease Oy-like [Leptopilina boulardi]
MNSNFFGKLCIFLTALSIAAGQNNYAILVFSQQWPRTTCLQAGRQPNECNIPHNDWTIHGIWPSKNAPERGPFDCDTRNNLNARNLNGIRGQLNTRWLNVLNNNPVGFWSHEWRRHGTCSLDIQALNSQFKYFNQGLQWNNNYVIGNILNTGGIRPGGNYALQDIQAALRRELNNFTPQVSCFKKDGRQFLHEVRICMTRTFALVNCANHIADTNCNRQLNIEYPR